MIKAITKKLEELKGTIKIDAMISLNITPYTTPFSIGFIISINHFEKEVISVYCTIKNLISLFTTLHKFFNTPLDDDYEEDLFESIKLSATAKYKNAEIVLFTNYRTEELGIDIQTTDRDGNVNYRMIPLNFENKFLQFLTSYFLLFIITFI